MTIDMNEIKVNFIFNRELKNPIQAEHITFSSEDHIVTSKFLDEEPGILFLVTINADEIY